MEWLIQAMKLCWKDEQGAISAARIRRMMRGLKRKRWMEFIGMAEKRRGGEKA
jgi:hypothetical protein